MLTLSRLSGQPTSLIPVDTKSLSNTSEHHPRGRYHCTLWDLRHHLAACITVTMQRSGVRKQICSHPNSLSLFCVTLAWKARHHLPKADLLSQLILACVTLTALAFPRAVPVQQRSPHRVGSERLLNEGPGAEGCEEFAVQRRQHLHR